MEAVQIPGNLLVLGAVQATQGFLGFGRTSLTQESLLAHAIPLTTLRVHDAPATNLPSTGATDDLGLYTGAMGTAPPTVQTGDLKAAGATTRYARFQVALPAEYVAGSACRFKLNAGMKTTISDGTATIDMEVYPSDGDGTMGSDVCATSATTINDLTAADKTFVMTATSLTPGMLLDCRIAIAINDGATLTAVIGVLNQLTLLCDRQG